MRWSKEKIWQWYNARPWMRGCNYMSADCANCVDQWQSLGFEERFETTKRELALMEETGFNTVRLIPEYVVWKEEHDGFMERFDRYLSLLAEHGISAMIVLANDCMPPKTERWKPPYIGEQTYDHGYHGGKKHSQHGSHTGPAPHFYLDDPETKTDYFEMVHELVTKYKNDARICVWDVYNEPGNSRRAELTLPILKELFLLVRGCTPSQPLTCGVWTGIDGWKEENEITRFSLENSDIISYHFYGGYNEHIELIHRLKKEGRPILNTEWLGRIFGNDVFSLFPLFYLEKIGCYNWGFVAGKYQTYEPWEGTWEQYYNETNTNVDFTKWFHDLYRPNHRPYDPKEIALIKKFCALADADFEIEGEREK